MTTSLCCDIRLASDPNHSIIGISSAAHSPSARPASPAVPSRFFVTNSGRPLTASATDPCRNTNAAATNENPARVCPISSTSAGSGSALGTGSSTASTETPSCSTAVAPKRPTQPMFATTSAASGGPATHATESSVRRMLTTIDGPCET